MQYMLYIYCTTGTWMEKVSLVTAILYIFSEDPYINFNWHSRLHAADNTGNALWRSRAALTRTLSSLIASGSFSKDKHNQIKKSR